jgi:hypothetical protein
MYGISSLPLLSRILSLIPISSYSLVFWTKRKSSIKSHGNIKGNPLFLKPWDPEATFKESSDYLWPEPIEIRFMVSHCSSRQPRMPKKEEKKS